MQLPSFLSRVRYNKTWLVLGAALAIGLLAAFAAQSYLARRMAEIEARSRGQTVGVVVAKRELRAGERISEDTVAVRAVPVDFAHSQAIRPESFTQVAGRSITYALKPGEMVLWSLLEGQKPASFSTRVADGRRAITVPVDEINSISGLLEPGDLIDLVLTLAHNGRKHSFVMQQKLRVLATGQRVGDDPRSGERRQYSTVTLDTTPEQADTIIRAREAGKLTALLRNPQDGVELAEHPLAARLLKDLSGEISQVPVLYGGRSGGLPPEGLHLGALAQGGAPGNAPSALPVPPMR
ncbi:Flp pilus assembly protein CpaB [Thauera sp. CAU 1555]|uniref:Flp pilus assembly protein CpaB n=1 Tax=Thauera sedimentorum TaxID=2767595 RepID=A0ABR9B5N1_9RHOO|nr:Flp pilus assembly protein CpaB [Thauera sedimentorum]MBC9070765.1 Flp pilus assembly protein CpaB [Thauera sedimentorum]MBD8501684.1 Flp pilus assembly protein CpaB [Thauera sedimentorum]